MTIQQKLDFSNIGYRKWAVEHSAALRSLSIVEGVGHRAKTIRLNPCEVQCVLYRLARFDDCYESVDAIAAGCGLSSRKVERILLGLQEHGLMEIDKVSRGPGFKSNRYIVYWSELVTVKPKTVASRKTVRACPPQVEQTHGACPPLYPPPCPPLYPPPVADNKENKDKETTTTTITWRCVVSFLENVGVSQAAAAAQRAQLRGLKAEDVLTHLQKLADQGFTNPGVYFNQAVSPTTQAKTVSRTAKPTRTSPEVIWTRAYQAAREQLKRIPSDDEVKPYLEKLSLLESTQRQANVV